MTDAPGHATPPTEPNIDDHRRRADVVAGHQVTLDADEWAVVSEAIRAADDVYVAAVVRHEDQVPFVQNRWSDGWVLPGGAVESGESLATAARREVREEPGLDATIEEPIGYVEQTFTPREEGPAVGEDAVTGHLAVFAATANTTSLTDAPGVTSDEISAVQWFSSVPDRVDGCRDACSNDCWRRPVDATFTRSWRPLPH